MRFYEQPASHGTFIADKLTSSDVRHCFFAPCGVGHTDLPDERDLLR